jgi:hypothetical protein
MSLLSLPADRIAQETRYHERIAVLERDWRRAWHRRVFWLGARCAITYVLGGVLAWGSLGLTGDVQQIAMWGGLLLSNAGPMMFAYAFWMRENGVWS